MPEEALQTCAYHILRYAPNLVRDEWVNIGVLIYDAAKKRALLRLIEEPGEFGRVRKLHPAADLSVLRALRDDFQAQMEESGAELPIFLRKLEETLSNALQLGPQKGILTGDPEAELDRVYRDQVALPRFRRAAADAANSRAAICVRATEVFRSVGILDRMTKTVPVAEFTYPGDPLKLDFGYRRNGTRGFVHALVLSRDPAQAKALAFTAEAIRAKLPKSEFAAVTEAAPLAGNEAQQFVARLLGGQGIELVPVVGLADFANRLRPTIH